MAYYAPNTPSPISSTQIGYSYTTTLDNATTTSANVDATATTSITNVPVGVWIISGYVLGGGNDNTEVLTHVYCQIFKDSVGSNLLNDAGYMSNTSGTNSQISFIYLTPSGVFHSNGSNQLIIKTGVRSSSSTTTCSVTGKVTLTKIA